MNGLNQVVLIGYLGADPELKFTQGGKAVLRSRLGITQRWIKDGQQQERTEWVTISTWGNAGEALSKFVRKGMLINVVGELRTSSWEKDGEKRYSTEVRSAQYNVLTAKGAGAGRAASAGNGGGRRAADGQHGGSTTSGGMYAPPADPGGLPISGDGYDDFPPMDDEIPFIRDALHISWRRP